MNEDFKQLAAFLESSHPFLKIAIATFAIAILGTMGALVVDSIKNIQVWRANREINEITGIHMARLVKGHRGDQTNSKR